MASFRRYGLYAVPKGNLYSRGAVWLGWDSQAGRRLPHPRLPGLPDQPETLTKAPGHYGFHGTIKPPFRLVCGTTRRALREVAARFCAAQPSVCLGHLQVALLGGFVALVPRTEVPALGKLAGSAVRALDAFRAPPDAAELARRRAVGLSQSEERNLQKWGYPYVMKDFRFHLTLTGKLSPDAARKAQACLAQYFADVLTEPVNVDSLCLMGEDDAGYFHLIERVALSG